MKKFVILAFSFLFLLVGFVFPFGKNKINYYTGNWYIYELGNYKLFLDVSQTNIFKYIVRAIKDSDEKLRSLTFRDLEETFPVIVFPNQIEFQANNIVDEFIGEGTGGFTEEIKNRLVVPMDGNIGFFKRVLNHEMVHVYQFDTIKSSKNKKVLNDITIPLWVMEGMAEYYSVEWDFSSEEILRDIVVNNRIVPLLRLSDLNSLKPDEYYLVYKEGQAFLKFIGDNYGKPSVYKIFKNYLNGDKDPYKSELGSSLSDIEKTFVYSLRKKYLPMLNDYDEVISFASEIENVNFGETPYQKFIPTFVSNNTIAFLTYKDIYPKIVLYDVKEKKIIKDLVIGGFNENYLEFHITRNNIAVSTNGIMVFVSKSGGKDAINVYDLSKNSSYQVKFDKIFIISSPDISLDGKLIAFSGFDNVSEDIYIYNLETKELKKVTDDIFYDGEPRFSPDKNYIYFVSTRNKESIFSQDTDIYRFNLNTGEIEKFIDLGGEEQNPFVSQDGKYLLFVSTVDSVRNIFVYDFGSGKVFRVSKVITGAFSPKLDPSSSTLIFSSENNLSYDIYYKSFSLTNLANVEVSNYASISETSKSNFLAEKSRIDGIEIRNSYSYSIIPTVDYITGGFSLSSDLGFMLLLGASFSDLLGDQRLSIIFNNMYLQNYGTFNFSEINLLASYMNLKYYFDFGFQFYNLRDYFFSLMNFFIYPSIFYQVEPNYYSKSGFNGSLIYPFSTFSRLELSLEHSDYFWVPIYDYYANTFYDNFMYSINTLSLSYVYDTTLWSVAGPIDGIRSQAIISYSPKLVSSDKSLFSAIFDFRKYFMMSLIDTLAFRFVGGYKFGLDVDSFPFYVGGVGTLRGYDFKEFSGKLLFLSNLELRIALIRALLGPFGFSFPPIFGSLFVDAALIGDDPTKFQLTVFDENEGVYKLKDLKVGVGVGVGIALGAGFKLKFDFASPFDGRKLLDAKDWKTYFQLGYEF
jgi:hypothetical protein